MRAVLRGALQEPDINCRLLRAAEAGTVDLLEANAVIFGTPENLGHLSGGMKDFFDRTYYPSQDKVAGLPYVLVVSAGNDGSGAVREAERILRGYAMKKVSDSVVFKGLPGEPELQKCEELGCSIAAGLALGVF
jgi:multimeric flavodoxin WrbA